MIRGVRVDAGERAWQRFESMHLILSLIVAFAASATEIDPQFGFELETRGPLGEVLCATRPQISFPALWSYAIVAHQLGALDPNVLTYGLAATFGSVFTQSSYGLIRRGRVVRWQRRYFKREGRGYEFTESEKWVDPRTGFWVWPRSDILVQEQKTRPATIATLRANADFLHETTFDRRANLGSRAAFLFGSGHVHIDLATAFGDDARLLADFVADLINHPGLYLGPLVRDRITSHDPRRYLARVGEVLARFEDGEPSLQTALGLALALRRAGLRKRGDRGPAVCLRETTLELRFPRAQRGVDEVLLWAELFRARLNYLKRNPGVRLKMDRPWRSPRETYEQIFAYVTESGLDWTPYFGMLPGRWRWYGRRIECERSLDQAR